MKRSLRQVTFAILMMLATQFILGMTLNLFETLPAKHPGQTGNYFVRSGHSFAWAITFGGGIVLFLHVLVALGLLGHSIMLFVRSIKTHSKPWTWVSTIGMLGIMAAFSNGLSFLDFNHDFSSFIMAMGYIVATIAYGVGLFMQPQKSTPVAKR